jgi:hypothetical protein
MGTEQEVEVPTAPLPDHPLREVTPPVAMGIEQEVEVLTAPLPDHVSWKNSSGPAIAKKVLAKA